MMINILVICLALLIGNLRFVVCQQTNYNCAVKESQANTTEKLSQLRARMKSLSLYAYIIFSEDEHRSEYVQQQDTRRAWITGFLGPVRSAVVTLDHAALWIDDQYWAQAENELDCANWLLMRQGEPGVLELSDWVASSPVQRTKAVKNPTEQKGMRDCGVRDSVARVRHLMWLENEIKNNRQVNETQAAERLEYYQSLETYFKEISFLTISAVGAHAATIHFQPNAETAAQITKDKVYLLDAGAQYLD
ncbi:unnamed protein product, partial [Rotaria sp. Silwood2]